MNEQLTNTTAPAKLPKRMIFAWPTRTISYAVGSVMLGYMTLFATDVMGIDAATAGIIFMISKIFDGFTDIVAGYLIDRTHSKLGKGRPYELALIGYWLFAVLLFSAPEMGVKASCVWLFVTYTMINSVFFTLLLCAEPVYLANALEDRSQSVSVLAITGFVSMVFTMVGAMVFPQMVASMCTTRAGWRTFSLIVAIPFTLLGLVRFFVVKERQDVASASAEVSTVKDMVRVLGQNKYILFFSLIIFISNVGSNLINGVTNYYFLYIMGDLSLASIASLSMLAIIVVILITPVLSKKFGFVNVMRVTTLIGMVGYLVRLIAPRSLLLIVVSGIFAMLGFYTMFAFANTFVIDCMDYGEWKTGVRSEGTVACAQSVTAKIGTAIGMGLLGVLMGMTGYNGALTVQPDSANTMIIMLYSLIPAVFCLFQYILLRIYDLDKLLPRIHEERAAKRAAAEQ